jgi:hypothetical protein
MMTNRMLGWAAPGVTAEPAVLLDVLADGLVGVCARQKLHKKTDRHSAVVVPRLMIFLGQIYCEAGPQVPVNIFHKNRWRFTRK